MLEFRQLHNFAYILIWEETVLLLCSAFFKKKFI